MKTIYLTAVSVLIIVMAQGQIPNAGFESWSNGNPTGWFTTNVTGYTGVLQSGNAHSGSSAAEMKVVTIASNNYGAALTTGKAGEYFFPLSSQPGAFYGWYISSPAGGDQLNVNSIVMGGNNSGYVNQYLGDTTAVYKQFAFNFIYPVGPAADSAYIIFTLLNSGGQPNANTYFIIDDLSFGPATGLPQLNTQPALEECVPNPASGTVNVIYSLPEAATVTVTLYDVLGHQVSTLLDNARQSSGRYKIPVDVSALPGGVYLCTLNADGQTYTQKLLVTK